jgi:hypothetical protein
VRERQRLTEKGCVAVSGEYWKISKEREKWEDALRRGNKTEVRYIEANLSMPTFLRQVAHIEFTQLRSLYLGRPWVTQEDAGSSQ